MNRMRGESEGRRQHMPALPIRSYHAPTESPHPSLVNASQSFGFWRRKSPKDISADRWSGRYFVYRILSRYSCVYADRLKLKVKPGRIERSMTWSYKKQRRLLQLAAQSKSPEAIANLMDRSPEKNRPRSTPTERPKAVRASASAGGRLGGLDRMMNGMKQALLVIGSTMALIVVGLVTHFAIAYPSIISLLTLIVVVPVFLILGLGFFKIARELN